MTVDSSEIRVFDEVVSLLTQVIGPDFLMDVEIGPATTFSDDLAMESIEMVALGEKLQERFGANVDFVAFVADMDIDEIISMNVGRLVTHIERSLANPAADVVPDQEPVRMPE
ncbi:phosphopantetheine-binding protein [Nocardia nepalensis]|uniref:phosphopantetheine-binding protein n=1 Tax=Nocardia nepalensis TaxID=3375448 RepID=UPI003B677AAF